MSHAQVDPVRPQRWISPQHTCSRTPLPPGRSTDLRVANDDEAVSGTGHPYGMPPPRDELLQIRMLAF